MGQVFGGLGDVYHVQKVKLGQGSFGQVWRAIDKGTSEIVAVKQLIKAAHGSGKRSPDFRREVEMMQKVSHENILKFIGLYEDDTFVSIVLEYCDGGDFSQKLKVRPEQPTGPCQAVVADWLRQICSAINALHSAHIVHRDVNPKNFMLARGVLKLADLGIAQFMQTPSTMLFRKCGTPGFMAPEQHVLPKGEGYSFPVDMWAAGIVFFMMLHGGHKPYFQGDKLQRRPASSDPDKIQANVEKTDTTASDFEDLLHQLLEANPKRRATAADALDHQWLSSTSSFILNEG